MKNGNLFLLLFSLLLLSATCNKEELQLTTVEGRVLEFGSNEPVAGARVLLELGTSTGGISGGSDVIRVDTAISKEDGTYFLSFWAPDYPVRDLFAEHDNYFDADPAIGIIANTENHQDILMEPHAWLRLHIKNINPFNESDNIRYNGNWGGPGPQDNPGTDVDFTDLKEVRGNQDVRLSWTVTKDGISTTFRDTIYCPAHETTPYEIFY